MNIPIVFVRGNLTKIGLHLYNVNKRKIVGITFSQVNTDLFRGKNFWHLRTQFCHVQFWALRAYASVNALLRFCTIEIYVFDWADSRSMRKRKKITIAIWAQVTIRPFVILHGNPQTHSYIDPSIYLSNTNKHKYTRKVWTYFYAWHLFPNARKKN